MRLLLPMRWLAWAFLLLLTARASAEESQIKHVVLVSIDGLAASYLDDPRANLLTLRSLRKEGATAKGMITSFPSVTWPSHTSLITGVQPGKHGVIGNNVWLRGEERSLAYIGDPERTKEQAVKVPTLYDVAHQAGLNCGGVIWPCTNGASSLKWMIPDAGRADLHAKYTTTGLVSELAKENIDISKLGAWGWNKDYSTERDVLYTKVAQYLLKKRGANLVLVHLVTPDGVEHAYGPHTPEAYQAVAESDQRIAELWKTLQEPPLAGKAALFVVSDHGFAPYEKFIRPNVVLKEMGLVAADEAGKVMTRKAWCVAQGGSAFIYVLDKSRHAEVAAELKAKLAGLEGVAGVHGPEEYARFGLPQPSANSEAPDLVLTTGPGYSFAEQATGEAIVKTDGLKGSHGHDPAPAYMHATFIAAGVGIKAGVQLERIQNVDVAPTIARLMGLTLQDVDGRVLKEILAD